MDKISEFKVYQTRDYSKFKKLLGNREVTPSRLTSIEESIIRIGYQPSPMIVNEKFEVIDGQGRLAACEALSLPVYYVIKKGLTIDDCISMNMKMENWKTADYIKAYADRGFPAYIKLRDDLQKFPKLNWELLMTIKGWGTGPKLREKLVHGKLQYVPLDYVESECARWLQALIPYIKEAGVQKASVLDILTRIYRYGMIDPTRMLESFTNYAARFGERGRRQSDILQFINEIYNFNRSNKVYFADDYRKKAEAASRPADRKRAQNGRYV